mgnify:CR=1 FL=1
MEDYKEFLTTCDICDSEMDLKLYNDDQNPAFCPMCGEHVEWEEMEDDGIDWDD